MTGNELRYIEKAHADGRLAGDGDFTHLCREMLESYTGTRAALLTHSCTAALEMTALLTNVQQGDEVVMPSFTFVSTANAFVMRGAIPVFVDIRTDTLNMDETLINDALTEKTKAIVPVHYAGVPCEMDVICSIAHENNVYVIEDAAQGVGSTYKGAALGAIGDFGAYSFHETKNIISGEGGALLVNREHFILPAEMIREKGTNRAQFFRGEIDKYTWQSIGSSFLPGELTAAFLLAQLEAVQDITDRRVDLWRQYHQALLPLEASGQLRRPVIPMHTSHNGHMYYVVLDHRYDRAKVIAHLDGAGIHAVFHYVPLHLSPAGQRFCRQHSTLNNTEQLANQLLRLPLWLGMTSADIERIASALTVALRA